MLGRTLLITSWIGSISEVLRIADVIAIGPNDKPKNFYPEIAVIDKETIIIKPHIIETRN